MTRKKKRDWAIIIAILLGLPTLIIAIADYANNTAPPKIEIGQYQSEPYVMVSNSVTVTITGQNQTTTTTTISEMKNETQGYNLYNITYEVRNTGKQTAHNIIVTGWVEPSENCSIISTCVYDESPLPANLLRTVNKPDCISFLGAGESYVYRFQMKDNNLSGQSIFHIDIKSDDAGNPSKQLVLNY